VVIGDDTTLDFAQYYHCIAKPDLRAFSTAGLPVSLMADLSDTLVVTAMTPTDAHMANSSHSSAPTSIATSCCRFVRLP
ncbi:cellulose biosynthesis cyclic di-GMP-binding regulatory protein BcsB, partial [Salmonella enterica]|uniref:cellulose biosynthesis cyclic di-GMP-binding regulatory protein BcsB n=1 Tax=Salmonella enterica TaxID=28901 RepID=UPI00398C2B53